MPLGGALVRYKEIKQRIEDISSMKTPPGAPGVSMNQELFIEFEFIEFGCDHQLLNELEGKNYGKTTFFDTHCGFSSTDLWFFCF